jgi:secreted trypsin-like serine protease
MRHVANSIQTQDFSVILLYSLLFIFNACLARNSMEQRRIIGGYPASEIDFPWIVLINRIGGRDVICTGFQVNKRWLVTAAHCLLNESGEGFLTANADGSTRVIIGCSNLTSSKCTKFIVETFVPHPCYKADPSQDHDDIAMMRLDTDAPTTPSGFALIDGIHGTVP